MTLEMNRPKCCCFTGHRENKLKRSEKEILEDLKQAINQAIDDGYTTFIKGAAEFPEIREINTSEPIMLKDHIRLSASEICGGYAFWTDDVSEIAEAISELQDINKTLNERHTLIREENRTNKQKAHLLEANRLYNRMQLETAPQLKKMQDLVSALYKEDKPENEKELLAELTLIGAYFKRRNNLLFISETQDTIRMAELGYCFQESVSALELQGVTGSCLVEDQGNISLSESIQLYTNKRDALLWRGI